MNNPHALLRLAGPYCCKFVEPDLLTKKDLVLSTLQGQHKFGQMGTQWYIMVLKTYTTSCKK